MQKNVKAITVFLLLGCTLALPSILGREFCKYQENPNKELDFFNEVNPFLEVSAPSMIQSLVFGTVQGNIVDLDPHYSEHDTDVIDQVVEHLYQFNISDPDLPIIPWLASAMPIISPDGKEYIIILRQGIKFHDGTLFNAAAVKWSFDRLCYFMNYSGNQYLPPPFNVPLPSDMPRTQFRSIYEQTNGGRLIDETEVLSPYSVKITLNEPKASFMSLLCAKGSGILSPDSTPPLRYYELHEKLVGTGPFIYKSFIEDVEVIFEGNPDYWGTPDNTGPTQLDSLTYMIVPDMFTLCNGLLSGDIDLIDTMDTNFIPQFEADPDIEIDMDGNTVTCFWTTFNYDHINLAMRRALSWCFNYPYMIDVICEGEVVRWPTYIPFGIPYANYNLNYPTFDIIEARNYLLNDPGYGTTLAAAGIDENSLDSAWTNLADTSPLEYLNYTYNIENDRRRDIGFRLASDARYIGVDTEVNGVIGGDFFDMIMFEREKMDMYSLGWGPDYLDPENYITPLYSITSAFNGGNFYEPDVQQLMDDGLTETDPIAREAIYQEIQRLLVEEYLPAMTLYTPKNYDTWRVGVKGWVPNPIERVWFYPVYFDLADEPDLVDESIVWDAPIQLTNNLGDDRNPQIHNGMVTWEGWDGINDHEIFLYDGISTHRLTDNAWDDGVPQIHNGMVTWYGSPVYGWEIFLYDGTSTLQLTDNRLNDFISQIHNGMVTWYCYDGDDGEIFLYDGDQTPIYQLTDNARHDGVPQIHNGMVTWPGWVGDNNEIFLYDGTSTHQLTDNSESDINPQIHNGMVTWEGWDGNDYEIFLWDGTSTYQLTDNTWNDYAPQIHNGMVTWYGRGSSGYDNEIFLYDGTFTYQLTNNTWDDSDPQIHNGMVTWNGRGDTYDDYEIFLIGPDITPPIFDDTDDVVIYEQGTIGHNITWIPNDYNPDSYNVIMNKIEPVSRSWIELDSGDWSGESISIGIDGLTVGTYAYVCTVHDLAGFSSSNTVLVIVYGKDGEPVTPRLQLELSGSFDYLEEEDIHLQIAGILTDSYTGAAISGATVIFEIYNPDGTMFISGVLVETIPGIYVYKAADTIEVLQDVLTKGIYLVYAHALAEDGREAVDMIQFHIDPPGDLESNPWLYLAIMGFGGLAFMSVAMIFMWRNYRRITH